MYIDTQQALEAFCQSLRQSFRNSPTNHHYLALDSEFIRDKTYYPRLCLLQIAYEDHIACIDPLVLDRLDPILELIYDPSITKILHSAQQDLEIFFHWQHDIPTPLFDTQIAAALLGFGEQIGYAALVANILGIELDKSQTRTDWSARPLSSQQIAYAKADVQYLPALYRHQCERLQSEHKLDWLAEDFAQLANPQRYQPNPSQIWKKIKGHGRLRGVQLAVLRALGAWREQQAMKLDKPRRWVLADDVLLDIARRLPETMADLQKIRNYRRNYHAYAEILIELLNVARQEPQSTWPKLALYHPLTAQQEVLVDILSSIVQHRALQHGLNPNALIGRKELEKILQNHTAGAETTSLQGWKAKLVGQDLAEFLAGDRYLSVHDGELKLECNRPKNFCSS